MLQIGPLNISSYVTTDGKKYGASPIFSKFSVI